MVTNRRNGHMKIRSVYLSDDAWKSLKAVSKSDGRSISGWIERMALGLMSKEEKQSVREQKRVMEDTFPSFWAKYPKKYAKEDARKAWGKLLAEDREAALKSLDTYRFPAEVKFIPYPATWLNGKRWQDAQDDIYPKQPSLVDWESAPPNVKAIRDRMLKREAVSDLDSEVIGEFMEQFQ